MKLELQNNRWCDFCNEQMPRYKWIFRRQVLPIGSPVDSLETFLEHPEWLACQDCHELVQAHNLIGLVKANKEVNTPELEKYFTKFYSSLLSNLAEN